MDQDKAGLVLNAIGLAVVELIASGMPITKENLVGRLEYNRKVTGNVIGKGANRDAAEMVRKGK